MIYKTHKYTFKIAFREYIMIRITVYGSRTAASSPVPCLYAQKV